MPQLNKKFQIGIRNQVASNGVLELHFLDLIYDQVTFDWWFGYEEINMVEDVINKVKEASPSVIKLIIDSEGGDAGIGLAIYNFLRSYKATKEVEVIGMAGSIASVLMQCASKGKRRMARNAFVVIHKAWGWGSGNADDLRAQADVIDKYTAQIVDVYVQNNTKGKTAEEINAMIADGDYWMTGTEALDLGFADELLANNDEFQIAARIQNLEPAYRNTPKNLAKPVTTSASTQEDDSPAEEVSSDDLDLLGTSITQLIKNSIMNFKEKMKAVTNKVRKSTVDKNAENLAEEVANVIADPLEEFAGGLQEEVEEEIGKIENRVTNSLTEKFEKRIKTLEDAHAAVIKENEDLKTELAEKEGSESTPKNQAGNDGVIQFGHGIVAK